MVKLAGFALAMTLAGPAFADGDSSADADGGFHNQVSASTAVILRVPINAAGEELSDRAEMRLYSGAPVSTNGDFATAFDGATPLTGQPTLPADGDSSTSFGYGWSGYGYGYGGWCSPYTYASYSPYYSYYGSSWGFGSPYYSNYYGYGYGRSDCYGYNNWRYYYYPRYW
jgi:hypothetical protein